MVLWWWSVPEKLESSLFSGMKLTFIVSVVYMAIFADFGDKEHVFSPVSDSGQLAFEVWMGD